MQILTFLALVQMPWTTHLPQHGIAVDFLRPKFDGGGTSLTSAAAYLSGRFRAGTGFSVRVEVPFAHFGGSGLSSTALGNPYLGVETTNGKVAFELGFRPALTPDDEIAPQVGFYSDVTRFEAFLPHLATLAGRVTYRNQTSTGMTVEVGGGPSPGFPPRAATLRSSSTITDPSATAGPTCGRHLGSAGFSSSRRT